MSTTSTSLHTLLALVGPHAGGLEVLGTYNVALIPYRGTWSGILAVSITP